MSPADDYPEHRPNVGVVLFHPDGRVWLGRRAGTDPPHNWQFPQGGVDPGEALEDAARRELQEETGATSATRPRMTPACSSFWIRFQQGVCDRPTRSTPGDPDYQAQAPPSFGALRTQQWLFVVYRDGERELYDLAADPHEQNNIAATADPTLVAGLYSQLQAMRACSGPSCLTADSIPLPQPTS